MKCVIVESPFRDCPDAVEYAKAAMLDCLNRGEAPLASHILYAASGVLDDANDHQRRQGMEAGFAWGELADLVVVYGDLGISERMHQGVERTFATGQKVEQRSLPGWPKEKAAEAVAPAAS